MKKYTLIFYVHLFFLVFVLTGCNSKIKRSRGYYYYTNGNQIYDTNQLAFLIEKENYEEMTSDFQAKMFQTKTTLNQNWLLAFNKSMKIYRDSIYEVYCKRFSDDKNIIDSIKNVGSLSSCLLYVINNKTKEVEHFSVNGRLNKNFKDLEIRNSRLVGTLAAFENGKDLTDNCLEELSKTRKNKGNLSVYSFRSLGGYYNFGSGGGSMCYPPYSYLDIFEVLKVNNAFSDINYFDFKSFYEQFGCVKTNLNAELNLFKALRNNGFIFQPKLFVNAKKKLEISTEIKSSTYSKMKKLLNHSMISGRGAQFYLKSKINENCWINIKSIDNFNKVLIYSSVKYTILIVEHSYLDFSLRNHSQFNYNTVNLLQLILKEMNLDTEKGTMYFKAKEYHKEFENRNAIEL